jgi:hypothetical protein
LFRGSGKIREIYHHLTPANEPGSIGRNLHP